MDHRPPNGEARESPQGAKGNCNPIGGTTISTKQYPGPLVSSCIYIKRWPSRPSLEREAHWTGKLYMPQYRGTPGPKNGNGWVGEWGGRVWETFGIALEMLLRKIRNKKRWKNYFPLKISLLSLKWFILETHWVDRFELITPNPNPGMTSSRVHAPFLVPAVWMEPLAFAYTVQRTDEG
jgi:hypothetical protein